jgi:hypothetical protein
MGTTNKYDWDQIQTDYDTGMTYRDIAAKYGMSQQSIATARKRGDIVTRDRSKAMNLRLEKYGPNVMGQAARDKLAIRMSENNPGGRSKWFMVAGRKVQGTWERDFALYLEEHGVEWQRGQPLAYVLDGKERRYTPDFYLPQFDRYVEVKGYWWGDDRRKMQAVMEQHQDKNFVVIESKDFSTITGLW